MTIALGMKQVTADRKHSSRQMRIGGRLLILLALPLAGLLAATGFGVYSGARQSGEASALKTRTDLAMNAFELASELQVQRAALVRGEEVAQESRDRVESATESIAAHTGSLDVATQRMAESTLRRVLGAQGVTRTGLGGDAAISSLSPAINSVLNLATAAINTGGTVDPAWASTADNLARAQAASAEEADRLELLTDADKITSAKFQVLVGLASSQRSLLTLAATSAPYEMAVRINRVGHGVVAADDVRQAAFADLERTDTSTWSSGVASRTDELRGLHDEAATAALTTVDDFAAASRRLLLLAAAAAVLTLVVTFVLRSRAMRSIAKPLAVLATEAEDVARVRLPEAVKAQQDNPDSRRELPALRAEGAAEVHEVAAAFNDIQNTALRLASEQAALRVNQAEALTNLGRRNQTLLVRQLDYITSLETEETDPKFLEHLFKLDHLASRMRRNAESLLILAGSETPRRRRSPAKITEVVRASMSEVEDFERVRIGHLVDSTLTGPVVIDLIHLLAELIENALGFSSPDTTVEIDGGPLGQGGYQFAVIDHGVGMSDVELQAANHRLAGLDEFDGMPTRYLGQYVVAKLATKIGVLVRLHPTNEGRGVSAIVTLPATAMFETPERGAVVGLPRPGSRAARKQGPEPFAPGSAVPHVDAVTPDPIEVPDLRDVHPGDVQQSFELDRTDLADEADQADRADQTPMVTYDDDNPERWDRVVDSVLSSVVDLSDLETATPAAPEASTELSAPPSTAVSPDEVAEVFGAEASAEPAQWWTAAEQGPNSPLPGPETPPADPPIGSPTTPPAFRPGLETPFQDWRVEPAATAASADTTPVQPVPTKPPPNATPDTPGPWAPESETAGSGLLRRRVPGASLAARSTGIGETAPKPVERSADEVRSRLASFQAGRNRGRTIPEADAGSIGTLQNETIDGSPEESVSDPETSQDRRFSK